MIALLAAADVFVPDGDDARRRAQEELSKGEYQAAKPNWFDQLAADIAEWFFGLFNGDGAGAVAPLALTMIAIVVIAAIVVALIVWGRPRASRVVRRRADLLGERDDRTAAQLRADAERRARDGDWDAAVVLRFRALARGLLERDLIDPAPGATAQGIAREAAPALPRPAARCTTRRRSSTPSATSARPRTRPTTVRSSRPTTRCRRLRLASPLSPGPGGFPHERRHLPGRRRRRQHRRAAPPRP